MKNLTFLFILILFTSSCNRQEDSQPQETSSIQIEWVVSNSVALDIFNVIFNDKFIGTIDGENSVEITNYTFRILDGSLQENNAVSIEPKYIDSVTGISDIKLDLLIDNNIVSSASKQNIKEGERVTLSF